MGKTAVLSKAAVRAASMKGLAKKVGKVVAKGERSTVAARRAALRADLDNFDVDKLLELEEKMGKFIDLVTLTHGETEVLDDKGKTILMAQFLGQRDIGEFVSVVKDKIKEMAFAHITAELEAQGIENAEFTNGTIEVPALGKVFCREGAGFSDPSIDEDKLRALLVDMDRKDLVDELFETKEVISKEYTLDLAKLFARVEEDPTLMLVTDESLTPGAPKVGRLNVRDL